jgi:hypothetical protein
MADAGVRWADRANNSRSLALCSCALWASSCRERLSARSESSSTLDAESSRSENGDPAGATSGEPNPPGERAGGGRAPPTRVEDKVLPGEVRLVGSTGNVGTVPAADVDARSGMWTVLADVVVDGGPARARVVRRGAGAAAGAVESESVAVSDMSVAREVRGRVDTRKNSNGASVGRGAPGVVPRGTTGRRGV